MRKVLIAVLAVFSMTLVASAEEAAPVAPESAVPAAAPVDTSTPAAEMQPQSPSERRAAKKKKKKSKSRKQASKKGKKKTKKKAKKAKARKSRRNHDAI